MPTPGEQKKVGIVPYDVRLTPGSVPTSGIFDEPTRPVCINVQWIAHVDGVLERLVWEDAWSGEDTEIEFAVGEIRKLMKALALGNSCMSLNPLQVRQNPEQPCILESSSDLGETWTPFADILACVSSEFLEQSIIDAISNNPELRDSINNAINGLPDVPGDLAKIHFPAFTVADCNQDAIYGYCKALWQYIDAKTVDFLQIMAESSNAFGPIDQLLQLIPGYELLPFDDVQDWLESFGDYNFEAYQSSKVVDLEQEIICDLYCIAYTGGCTLDFGDVYDYFIAKLGGINAPTVVATFAEWVIFMATGDYPNDRIVYLWSAFQLALAFVGQEFLGQSGIERYALYAQAGDPDNEWSILCDECNEAVTETWDFTLSSQDPIWYARPSQAEQMTYVSGQGWRGNSPGGSQLITERYNRILEISATYTFTATPGTNTTRAYHFIPPGTVSGDIGNLPFSGDVTLANALGIVATRSTGTFIVTIHTITITGYLA